MKNFLKDKNGNMAILGAVALVPLIISFGVSVEYRKAVNVRDMLQQSLDAGVLAGAKALIDGEDKAKLAAASMFRANAVDIYGNELEISSAVPSFTIKDGVVTGTFRYNMATPLLGMISVEQVPIQVTSAADSGGAGLELVMVVDVSSSMKEDNKIAELRKSAVALIDKIYGTKETRANTWVAVVPFDGRVNTSTYNAAWIDKTLVPKKAGTNMNCTGLRSTPNRISDVLPEVEKFPPYLTGKDYGDPDTCGGTKVRGWSFEKSPIRKVLDELQTGYGTSVWEGAAWGYRMLSPEWKGKWGLADLPHSYEKSPPKVMILMTDGENTPGDYGDPFEKETANAMQEATCAEMKKKGIIIYAIGFDISNAAATPLRNCASSPKHYFNSSKSQGLTDIFKKIGASVSSGSTRLTH